MTEYVNMAEELLSHLPMRSFMVKSLAATPNFRQFSGELHYTDWIIRNNQYIRVIESYIPTPYDILVLWAMAIESHSSGLLFDYDLFNDASGDTLT